jgi:hypothetical protein
MSRPTSLRSFDNIGGSGASNLASVRSIDASGVRSFWVNVVAPEGIVGRIRTRTGTVETGQITGQITKGKENRQAVEFTDTVTDSLGYSITHST